MDGMEESRSYQRLDPHHYCDTLDTPTLKDGVLHRELAIGVTSTGEHCAICTCSCRTRNISKWLGQSREEQDLYMTGSTDLTWTRMWKRAQLAISLTQLHLELACMDILSIEQSDEGHKNTLQITSLDIIWESSTNQEINSRDYNTDNVFAHVWSIPIRQSTSRVTLSKNTISVECHDTQKVAFGMAHVEKLVKL